MEMEAISRGIQNSLLLRWILLLPAALAVAAAAFFALRLMLLAQGYVGGVADGIWFPFILNVASHGTFGYLFIAVGTAMAPAARTAVLIGLFVLIVVAFSLVTLVVFKEAADVQGYANTLGVFCGILGGGYYMHSYFADRKPLFWPNNIE